MQNKYLTNLYILLNIIKVKKSRSMHGTDIKCQMFVRKYEVTHRQRCKDNNKNDLKKLGEGIK